jgi:hypothetical protein
LLFDSLTGVFFVILQADDRLFVAGCFAQGTHNA